MTDLDDFWVHTATVTTLTGSGGMGDTYDTPATVTGFCEDKRRLVRGPDGAEVVSETTWYGPVTDIPRFTPGTLVTLPSGRVATVIVAATLTSESLNLPDHLQAALT